MVYHTITWLMWLAAAAYLALVNHQPLVSILLILAAGSIFGVAGKRSALGQSWGTFLRLGLSVWLVALTFNLISTHAGRMVLVTLPRSWPLIGGPITLEALLYGLASGASLFAMLLVFATFNLAVDQHRLLRWVPSGLYQAGLVVSIALAFVPQMMASLQDIREAQRIRGHKFKGIRDLVPLFVPLITTGLERSMTLAESIEARGFGGVVETQDQSAPAGRGRLNAATLAGLLAMLAGLIWQAMKPQMRWPAWLTIGLGTALVLSALYMQGRRVRRSHYLRELWRQRDTGVCVCSGASIGIVAYMQATAPLSLWYYPYPPYSPWPTFPPLLGIAAVILAAPALLWPAQMRRAASHSTALQTAREASLD